jgi:S1-C subfamily serine protease
MRPKPNQIGGPVVDLKGKVVGITLARADRTRSFVMPAAAVEELLKQTAQAPSQVQAQGQADEQAAMPVRETPPTGHLRPGGEARMRRHLAQMQRLMEFMRDEMGSLEDDR